MFKIHLNKRLMLYCCIGVGLLTTTVPNYAITVPDSDSVYDYLSSLSLEELGEVEVTLSDVFDIFDAVVAVKEVSVATGTNQSTARAPAVTSVITASDIEAIGATDLDEVLETVPGLHVSRRGFGYAPIYSFRGIYTANNPQALVLINGIPITSLLFGNRNFVWGGMPINNIARIEIVRGPGSAVFGADAFSGVINILTKTKEDIDGTEIGTRVGSFDTYDAYLLHANEWNEFDIALSMEYHDTKGHGRQIEADFQTAYDKIFGTKASIAPNPVNLQQRNFDANMNISRGNWRLHTAYQGRQDQGTGTGPAAALTPLRLSEDRISASLTYHNPKLTKNWDVTAQLSFFEAQSKSPVDTWGLPPGAFGGAYPKGVYNGANIYERRTYLNLSGFYSGFDKHTFRLGLGYYYGDLYKITESRNIGINPATGLPLPPGSPIVEATDTPYASMRETARQNWHFYVQDSWAFIPDWELTAGVRYDEYSDFGSTTNPRLALVWQMTPDLFGKVLYGRAFRAPSFRELYGNYFANAPGNPNLQPETIDTLELALDYSARKSLHLALNLFAYEWRDAVRFVPGDTEGTFVIRNAGKQTGSGFEVETRWLVTKNFSLLANYGYQHAIDENDHDPGLAPHQTGYLRTDWLVYPNWYLNTQVNWIADRKRAFGDPRTALDDYTTVDLTLRRKDIREGHWNFAMGVRNLLDVDAREPSGGPSSDGIIDIPNDLPLAGRNYFMELRYRF
ncbi:MAG TPA: TonB-dependent receptor [Thiotrichaceae bacterium]|nr:TonB-dependent receptor [Thiotrichaceae bacterium]